jgi:hypothetical protein
VNNDMERMWMEEVVDYFKPLPRNLAAGTGENNQNPNQDSRCSGQIHLIYTKFLIWFHNFLHVTGYQVTRRKLSQSINRNLPANGS